MEDLKIIVLSIVLIIIFIKIITGSIKILGKLIINGIIGVVSLFVFNLIGGLIGLNLEINAINAIISGIFGIPGIIMLLFINA